MKKKFEFYLSFCNIHSQSNAEVLLSNNISKNKFNFSHTHILLIEKETETIV